MNLFETEGFVKLNIMKRLGKKEISYIKVAVPTHTYISQQTFR